MQTSENSSKDAIPANLSHLSGFDKQHPPDSKLIDTCVHCGFCLSTCPSYRVIGKEMDSPRGRIYLMDAVNEGEIPLSKATVQHFDSCLGCLACVTTCPSGVQYDKLISATRPQVERNYPRNLGDRLYRQLIFSLFPYPNRLRFLLAPLLLYQKSGVQKLVRSTKLLQRFSPRLAAMESILPQITLNSFQDKLPTIIPAQGEKRYRVGMILGCVQRLFFSPINEATVRVLTANGCEVVIPKTQGCCAALPHHQGQEEQAKALARQMIDSFADTGVDAVIINAAGCGHTLKEYGHLLQDDPEYCDKAKDFAANVKDAQEFLASVGLTAKLSPLTEKPLTLVYQDACHLLHGQKISIQPRQLLRQIPGVQLREPLDAALCCGSAGVYNMLQPEVADELGKQKVQNLLNTGAELVASANPGCTLQITKHMQQQSSKITVMHPMELLDYSIRAIQLDVQCK
ncbi:4Fe-4S dicluster domain-containing protein [Gloeocapsopsis crepidinum LEGE 06123]|uniref:Glycolate oxidase iron-sulfur subunit n=1 Tax=Gloeocapsopsis crepidinum LEGE 06123 TaxID=588587 RepID=A0ABR9UWL0_9CHRO|nr:heterodisulfide reductase-related iron-sulfur binding cluster [Gloeocapsopsis crepidinum]MBE9192674.1 4Fe-4S dicluster domain-containing protein [Gloeocapsopsis crepidinum LEGE 06123]